MRLKDVPNFESLQHFASKYKELDISAIEATLHLHRLTGDLYSAFDAHFNRHGLSRGRFMILMMLLRQESLSLTPAEIADACSVTRATVTGLIDTLESSGLVERLANPDDRRTVVVRLTSAGQAHLDTMLPDHYRRIAALMRDLSKDERTQFVRLINKIRGGIAAVQDP